MKLYTDAAVNGDPGQAGVGFVVLDTNRHDQLSLPLPGTWNNHAAEFEAVVQALTWLSKEDLSNTVLFLYTDSKLVADSLKKKYAKKEPFSSYVARILTLLEQVLVYEIQWIPESKNRGADNLAHQGLQQTRQYKHE